MCALEAKARIKVQCFWQKRKYHETNQLIQNISIEHCLPCWTVALNICILGPKQRSTPVEIYPLFTFLSSNSKSPDIQYVLYALVSVQY